MNMMNAIENDERIAAIKKQFEASGLNWDVHVSNAINQATAGIKNPVTKQVVDMVLHLLEKELEKCVVTVGTTLLQKLWTKIKSWFSKK